MICKRKGEEMCHTPDPDLATHNFE